MWMAGCSLKVHRRAKADAGKHGTKSEVASVNVQSRPKSYAYLPYAGEEIWCLAVEVWCFESLGGEVRIEE
jgi:hypothetical protein